MDQIMDRIKTENPEIFKTPSSQENEHSISWVRCIDDTVLWEDTLDNCIKQTFIFIQECAAEGVVFNKKKFQFACDEV